MTELLLAHDKYGISLYRKASTLLQDRIDEGWWYDDEDEAKARKALATSEDAAEAFLESRCDHEYEYIEWQAPLEDIRAGKE